MGHIRMKLNIFWISSSEGNVVKKSLWTDGRMDRRPTKINHNMSP